MKPVRVSDSVETDHSGEDSQLLTDEQIHHLLQVVKDIIHRYEGDDFQILLAGSPIVIDNLKRNLIRNLQRFMTLAILSIAIFLFLLLRHISGTVLPLLIVICSLVSTLSLMSIFDKAIKLPTQILPSFLTCRGNWSIRAHTRPFLRGNEKRAR